MALRFHNSARYAWASIISAMVLCFAFVANAQSSVYGLWHFHSSNGYKGYISLDGVGGCSYFISSAFLTIQATCVSRELEDGGLLLFGTQEGTSNAAPAYGDQLANPTQTSQITPSTTAVTFHIDDISETTMSGVLITASAKEKVHFTR